VDYVFDQQDYDSALKLLDWRDRLEMSIILQLKKKPRGYQNALLNINRLTRTLYLHSYQSYVWNMVVSKRI